MHLPSGVFERPREPLLIAKDRWGIIRIDTHPTKYPHNRVYSVPDDHSPDAYEYSKALMPFLRGDWEDFDRYFQLAPLEWKKIDSQGKLVDTPIIFSRAEHKGEPSSIRLPNIMVLPNLVTKNVKGLRGPLTVFGCSMGHYHPLRSVGVSTEEVIEFQSYGMLVLDSGAGEIELWIAKDGDKVTVTSGCYKTLYNLRDFDNPLITLDFSADTGTYTAEKMDVARNCGPVLLAYYDNFDVVITLNRLYINNEHYPIGVRLSSSHKHKREREVRIRRRARLDLGELLYEELTSNPSLIGQLARLGIVVKRAAPEVTLESAYSSSKPAIHFSRPLVDVAKKGTKVYRYFFPTVDDQKPGPVRIGPVEPKEGQLKPPSEPPQAELKPLNRPLVIVVEGGGDWVAKTYRKLFKKKIDLNKKLVVFYADDTRWKGKPKWADPNTWASPSGRFDPNKTGLQSWEVYLDKKNPDELARYANLRPDVVFVVTPDFTHSGLARQWLGKTPTVFIEKPFDSQVRNVDDLKLRYAFEEAGTKVLGLDHYQFYALPVYNLMNEILAHLGQVIVRIEFYLTEAHEIEDDRVQSLQYGLTLDLLPHLIALLTYFGDIRTIDEFEVVETGQYDPLVSVPSRDNISDRFAGETYARVRFTFEDDSKTGFHIPCLAVVGKGFAQEVKYLEVTGQNGNAIRVDLLDKAKLHGDFKAKHSQYPFDSIFFILNSEGADAGDFSTHKPQVVEDPFREGRNLHILPDLTAGLARSRYEGLLDDLLNDTTAAVGSTLRVNEGQEIVRILDRIWRAIHGNQDLWKKSRPDQLKPIQPQDWS